MSTATTTRNADPLTAGQLPGYTTWVALAGSLLVAGMIDASLLGGFDPGTTAFLGAVIFLPVAYLVARVVQGRRAAADRLATNLVTGAFLLALLPLLSLLWETLSQGLPRFDVTLFTWSMRNVIGDGGGAAHALYGTLYVTGIATLISVPIGLMTAIYLVEYGRGALARGITFFVDVMTGIPSIVAGLFAYALMAIVFGPGTINGFAGSLALSVLMIPIVVRATEELLRIVPNELREASYALGVPKWRTITSVVLPTAVSGIVSGVILSIARIIGETAPLMIAAGFTNSINTNPFANPMMTLPVFVYDQYAHPGVDRIFYNERAWAGALTLIVLVMVLNLLGRFIANRFSPKTGR
ncbi:phosphate ABC transporter permease PstA [Micropruina sonneratiae]|uniref:phosphate ABC transporter permease PstA n=1 Tax=Micropruina sonneratiae TaxID=2986940 RepID=UPI002225B9CD|nr:phosphate ABC transporter permease PstA [Micropruina sp. KQZ13P-5]MCW3156648.1 phosphate ABC transporter permease PstA [Micropruina sp. KQZ13P-5]